MVFGSGLHETIELNISPMENMINNNYSQMSVLQGIWEKAGN